MRMNIYVQDDLAEQVKQIDEINVSGVCQEALRSEVERRRLLAKLDEGMERVELYVERPYESEVAFQGRLLAERGDLSAYLTRHHRIAVYDGNDQSLHQYESFTEMANFEGIPDQNFLELISAVAADLGEEHVIELDI